MTPKSIDKIKQRLNETNESLWCMERGPRIRAARKVAAEFQYHAIAFTSTFASMPAASCGPALSFVLTYGMYTPLCLRLVGSIWWSLRGWMSATHPAVPKRQCVSSDLSVPYWGSRPVSIWSPLDQVVSSRHYYFRPIQRQLRRPCLDGTAMKFRYDIEIRTSRPDTVRL